MQSIKNFSYIFSKLKKGVFYNSKYFKKIFLSFLLISCIMFLIFSSIITILIDTNSKENLLQLNKKIIYQSDNITKNYLGDIYGFTYSKLIDDPDVVSLLYSSEFTPNHALNAKRVLTEIKSFSSLIHSIYIINFNTGHVITDSNNRLPLENFYDPTLLQLIKGTPPSRTPLFFIPRKAPFVNQSKPTEVKMLSLIYHHVPLGSLVINIDQEKFIAMVNTDDILTSTDTLILNRYGQVLTHTQSDLFGLDYSNEDLYFEIVSKEAPIGTFSYTLEDENYYVTYSKSNSFGFIYVTLMNNSLFNTSNNLLTKCITYSTTYLLLAFILSCLLSIVLYKPLGNLKKSITTYGRESKLIKDEFSSLTHIYKEIIGENTLLKRNASKHKKEINLVLLKKLLDPHFMCSALSEEDINYLNLIFPDNNYLIVLLVLDPSPTWDESTEDIPLIKFAMSNILSELITSSYIIETIDTSKVQLTTIINFNSLNHDLLTTHLTQIQYFMQQHFGMSISCGIGTIISDLEEISLSYDHAYTALYYRLISGYCSINHYAALKFMQTEEQVYPYAIEHNILISVKLAKFTEIETYLHSFFETIKPYHFEQIIQYVLQLNASLQNLQYNLEVNLERLKFDPFFFYTNTLYNIEALFLDYCNQITYSLIEAKSQDSNKLQLIQTVIDLVDQNIYNPNLSVVFLADQVHLSVNYLRNIYKEHTKESLFNYIINKRLDLICSLLVTTDLSIQDISEQLGFSTKNYFSTFFKKNVGMTPSHYRLIHKSQEDPLK